MTKPRDSIAWTGVAWSAPYCVRYGRDTAGRWWIDDMPHGADLTGPYDDEATAREAAEAAAMLIRLREGMAGRSGN